MMDPQSTLIAKSTLTVEPHLWLLKGAKQTGDNLFLESKTTERDQTTDSAKEPPYSHARIGWCNNAKEVQLVGI